MEMAQPCDMPKSGKRSRPAASTTHSRSLTQCSSEIAASRHQADPAPGAIVGDEIWNQQAGVRVKLGPLGLTQYLDFLPSGTAYESVRSLAKFASRGEIDFEIQLILKKEEVPPCELGLADAAGPRLGWTSWAKTRPLVQDANDTILRG